MHPHLPMLSCIALVLLAGCSSPDSPEVQVRQVIDQMEAAAEARDTGDFMEFVSDNFRDEYGQGPDAAARYARGYFIANQSLHLLTRVNSIEFPAPDEARADISVGMVGREADAATAWNLAADLYDFDVVLRREGDEWKVTYAKWRTR